MKNANKLVSAALTILLGVLLIIMKEGVLSIALTILGVALIVLAVLDLLKKQIMPCVIKAVIGVVIIVLGWVFIKVAYIIMAIALILYGALQLVDLLQGKKAKEKDMLKMILQIAIPAVCVIAGIFLFFDASWVYILAGIFLLINGGLALVEALKK